MNSTRKMKTDANPYVFSFEDGDGKDKQLLGGKGANLCEMTQIGLADAGRLSLPQRVRRELRNTMASYIEHTVGRPLKSVQFIRKLSR